MLDQCKWWILPARYEFLYTYDKVGNRTVKYEFFVTNSVGSGLKWTCTYNGLNQLTQQNKYSADSLTLDRKWLYTYDADGNLTTKEKQTSAGVKEEKWVYTWNPRNQMTLAEKFTGTNDTYAGKVAYRYCLSCDSVLSERIEYSPTVSTTITSRKRYEYDGLNLMRMDERYDTAGGAIGDQDPWRTLEVSTHKPGSLGALIGKRVYTHTNNDATPDATNDYTYTYDAVGNVVAVYNANVTNRGNELYYFTQDAFGNELTTSPFSGTAWSTARTAGITEHQTGKWIDPFTGLYYFHARWYDSTVGRFVGRDSRREEGASIYSIPGSNPMSFPDPSGKCYRCSGDESPSNTITPCPDPDQHPQPTPVPAPVPPPRPMPWPNCVNADGSDTYYGNWCGAGGHEWDDPIRLVYYIIHCTPVDDLDMCCFEHDFCYFIYGVNFNYGCAAKTQAEKWCDKELCNCATRSGNGPNNYKNMLMWLFCSCTE